MNIPPQVKSIVMHMMRSRRMTGNPVLEKPNEEHIVKIPDYSRQDDERDYK